MSRHLRAFGIIVGVFLLLLALPASASAASAPSSASPAVAQSAGSQADPADVAIHGCPFLYFCAYSGTNFTGSVIPMLNCQLYTMPFAGEGSWVNNQTRGTRAEFLGSRGQLLNFTAPAPSQNASKNWTNVFFVKPC